jgi:hypothetical protein
MLVDRAWWPADLEGMVRKIIRPGLVEAVLLRWGLHAFRRGLATNLHEAWAPPALSSTRFCVIVM